MGSEFGIRKSNPNRLFDFVVIFERRNFVSRESNSCQYKSISENKKIFTLF